MSKYLTFPDVEFRDRRLLVKALVSLGWKESQIEVHEQPQHLYGYKNDVRPETAHVIVRRNNIGSASNDLGFVKGPHGWTPLISEWDKDYLRRRTAGKPFMPALKASYAEQVALKAAASLMGSIKISQQGAVRKIVVSY